MGKLAAAALAAQDHPSLANCSDAVAQLGHHAKRPWPHSGGEWRALRLHGESELDSLEELMGRAAEELDAFSEGSLRDQLSGSGLLNEHGVARRGSDHDDESPLRGTGPNAALLRAWSTVLLAPALQWNEVVQQCRQGMVQHRVQLLVPQPAPTPSLPRLPSLLAEHAPWAAERLRLASWPRPAALDGLTVLLPLPTAVPGGGTGGGTGGGMGGGATSSSTPPACVHVEVLPAAASSTGRPRRLSPPMRLRVPPGAALVLDGGTRWRLVRAEAGHEPAAYVVFEYQSRPTPGSDSGAGWAGTPTLLMESAVTVLRGVVADPPIEVCASPEDA